MPGLGSGAGEAGPNARPAGSGRIDPETNRPRRGDGGSDGPAHDRSSAAGRETPEADRAAGHAVDGAGEAPSGEGDWRGPARIDHLADGAIRIEIAGDASPESTARVVALARALRAEAIPGVLDILPAYVTVVVTFDPVLADPDDVAATAGRLVRAATRTASGTTRQVTLPVAYGGPDGPDLDDVARHVGLAPGAVIARHAAETYVVACLGFAPGFPFLLGLPPDLATPRLTSPRTTTPVGSVAIGGVQTGVYPLATPGGWRVIGRTPVPLFDPAAREPFLLAPGDRLRFASVDAATAAAIAAGPDPRQAATVIPDTSAGLSASSALPVEPGPDGDPRLALGALPGTAADSDPAASAPDAGTVPTPLTEATANPSGAAAESEWTVAPPPVASSSAAAFAVLGAGLLTTVQDLGRPGLEHLGVSAGGAVDRMALRLGNVLAGNVPGAAALEITLGGPRLRLDGEGATGVVVVVGGADLGATVDGQPLPPWVPALVPPGGEIAFEPGGGSGGGARAYLCIAGGIDLPVVLGSRATDLTGRFGGLGGRALRAGDRLPIGASPHPSDRLLRRRLAVAPPSLDEPARLAVVIGPQRHRFTDGGIEALLGGTFVASTRADRLGIRLTGPEVTLAAGADMLSEGIAPGSIQVPGDGQPIVLLRARQTVGGYPKVATVITADLDRLAQVRPGDPVTFEAVDRHEARRRALAAHARWRDPIREEEPRVRGVGRESGGDASTVATSGHDAETPGLPTDGADRREMMDRSGSPPRPGHDGPDHPDALAGSMSTAPGAWDPDGVVRVIRAAREAELREVRLRTADLEVHLRWDAGTSGELVSSPAPGPSAPSPGGSPAPALPPDDARSVAAPTDRTVVRAPLLGLFYRRPSPADEPFVAVGQSVNVGQTVGLIEVMKTFHEVTADAAGTVVAFLVEDGQFVEYGTPLVEIETG